MSPHPTLLCSVPHCCLQPPGHHCLLWLLAGGLLQHSHHLSGNSMGASRGPLLLLRGSSLSMSCRELQGGAALSGIPLPPSVPPQALLGCG